MTNRTRQDKIRWVKRLVAAGSLWCPDCGPATGLVPVEQGWHCPSCRGVRPLSELVDTSAYTQAWIEEGA